jgi:hypothetical protein
MQSVPGKKRRHMHDETRCMGVNVTGRYVPVQLNSDGKGVSTDRSASVKLLLHRR